MPYRVMMIHPTSNWGGGTIAFLKVAEALRRSTEYEPLLVLGNDGMAANAARNMGIPVHIVKIASLNRVLVSQSFSATDFLRFMIYIFPSVWNLRRLMNNLQVDIVYINSAPPIAAGIAARTLRLPIIWHVREVININTIIGKLVKKIILRFSDTVVANSDYSASQLQPSDKVERIYDGVALVKPLSEHERSEIRKSWNVENTTPVVGMISPLLPYKGQLVMLEAIPAIVQKIPEARCVIFGDTPTPHSYWQTYRGRLRQLLGQCDFMQVLQNYATRHGLQNYIRWQGWCSDVTRRIGAMDIVVFPSLIPEGFGRPIVEAGAAGRPIVASDIGPARELVQDGVSGLLFTPGSASECADKVNLLLKNKQLQYEMGKAGRKRVERLFSDEVHASEILRVFRRVQVN